ncbi:MAG: hypothetical protein ACRD2O_18330, partial [Terriglobia bacterium]
MAIINSTRVNPPSLEDFRGRSTVLRARVKFLESSCSGGVPAAVSLLKGDEDIAATAQAWLDVRRHISLQRKGPGDPGWGGVSNG